MIRAPSSGSPAARSSSISETLLSSRIFLVCTASREISRIGEPSAWAATLTREQYGSWLSAIRVASAPCRLRRSSDRASLEGSKSAVGCIRNSRPCYCNEAIFRVKRGSIWGYNAEPGEVFAELGHTSAQLALLVECVQSPFVRRIAGLRAVIAALFRQQGHAHNRPGR